MPLTIAQILQNKNPKVKRIIKKPKLVRKFQKITETPKKTNSIIPQQILKWLEINPKQRFMQIQKGINFRNIKTYLKILTQEKQIKKEKIGQFNYYSKN